MDVAASARRIARIARPATEFNLRSARAPECEPKIKSPLGYNDTPHVTRPPAAATDMATPTATATSTAPKYPDRQSLPGSAERNAPLLREHLARSLSSLPDGSIVLEIASGHGHLIAALAEAFPRLHFQPTEADSALTSQIAERVRRLDNISAPHVLEFDDGQAWQRLQSATQPPPSLVLIINVLHIVPWQTVQDVWTQLANLMPASQQGKVSIYGAFDEDGKCTSDGNARVSANERVRCPRRTCPEVSALVTRSSMPTCRVATPPTDSEICNCRLYH